jgi:hypothetical protein
VLEKISGKACRWKEKPHSKTKRRLRDGAMIKGGYSAEQMLVGTDVPKIFGDGRKRE